MFKRRDVRSFVRCLWSVMPRTQVCHQALRRTSELLLPALHGRDVTTCHVQCHVQTSVTTTETDTDDEMQQAACRLVSFGIYICIDILSWFVMCVHAYDNVRKSMIRNVWHEGFVKVSQKFWGPWAQVQMVSWTRTRISWATQQPQIMPGSCEAGSFTKFQALRDTTLS
jgi:hypothetical protein